MTYCKAAGNRNTPKAWLFSLVLLGLFLPSTAAWALDVFTLWRQPSVPLNMVEGAWVEYRFQVMTGGRRQEDLVRIVCLDDRFGTDENAWVLEIVPLDEASNGTRTPIPGQGVSLRVSRSLQQRQGRLVDAVLSVTQWQDGHPRTLTDQQWRDDPLVAASLSSEFVPDSVDTGQPTHRVIEGQQLLCEQFVLTATDTLSQALPAGTMIQETTHEVSAAVNPAIPFLGIAYAAERVRDESRLDPPSRRFKAPPARTRVEVMELLAFGDDAVSHFKAID